MQPVRVLDVGQLNIGEFLAARRQDDARIGARASAEHLAGEGAARTGRGILHELPTRKPAEDTHAVAPPCCRSRKAPFWFVSLAPYPMNVSDCGSKTMTSLL